MRRRLKRPVIAGIALIAAAILIAIFATTGESQEKRMGPDEVVIAFTDAMKTGDFETARHLCDTTSMKDYLSTYLQEWEKKSRGDSADFAAMTEILAETSVSIYEMEEADAMCSIKYTLELNGNSRKCHATMKKEEGEWKVAAITKEN